MAFSKGQAAKFTLATFDLSAYVNNVTFSHKVDALDVTTFGNASHRKAGGLFDGTLTASGVYDDSSTGPSAKIRPLLGTVVAFVWQPEGAAAGQTAGNALVVSYEETGPVADMVSWSVSLEMDSTWTATTT
jgi:predicted secreted protein